MFSFFVGLRRDFLDLGFALTREGMPGSFCSALLPRLRGLTDEPVTFFLSFAVNGTMSLENSRYFFVCEYFDT